MSALLRCTLPGLGLFLCLAWAPEAAAQDSMRCAGGGLVSVGDSKIDLLGKCGGPTLVEERLEEHCREPVFQDQWTGCNLLVSKTIERWTYNFGPNQFVQYVTLDTGRITAIWHGSYGYTLPSAPPSLPPLRRARCEPSGFHVGDSTFDVLARCGPPTTRDTRVERQAAWSQGNPPVVIGWRTVSVEVWGYDFGPQSFVRHLIFSDGRVTTIGGGSYGYSRN